MEDKNYDILIYMSDQHSGLVTGYGGNTIVRTPNLDRIAAESAVFTHACTSCPICVPARASFMTSRMPSSVGVYGNKSAYASHEPTFIHALGAGGYETVLCGRMHFMGMDQRHGFDKRIAKDITPTHWGYVYNGSSKLQKGGRHAEETTIYAPEENTAFFYDKYVVNQAIKYLSEDHERNQAIVVGTYMPHMPLGGPAKMVEYYRDKVMENFHSVDTDYIFDACHKRPCFDKLKDTETLREIRANYYAMVEAEDELIGQVYDAFTASLKRNGRSGIFIYLSDHGDQMGEKGYIGKRVFFEDSLRIPMLIHVDQAAPQRIDTPVSIMDIGPTLCALTNSDNVPLADGRNLSPAIYGSTLSELPIVSEFFGPDNDFILCAGFMVRYKNYKYITYTGHEHEELLFDLEKDPGELNNLITRLPRIARDMDEIAQRYREHLTYDLQKASEEQEKVRLLQKWGLTRFHVNESWEMD